MNMISPSTLAGNISLTDGMTSVKQATVMLVSDDADTVTQLAPVCEFLDLHMEVISAGTDLEDALKGYRPMAVISDLDGKEQDGFHTMRMVAQHDRALPVMLLTAGDAVMMGAVDAIQDLCGLTSVTRSSAFPMAGQLVAFLFNAGRRAGALRLVQV